MTTRVALLALLLSASWSTRAEEPSPPAPEATTAAPGTETAPPPGILTKAPVLKRFVEATYPPEAEAARLEGAVLLEIEIGVDGKVANPRVVEPAGHGFDESALAAVAQFEFEPAEIDQKPAAVRVTYRYEFVYRPPPAPEKPAVAERPHVIVLEGTVLERGTRIPLLDAVVTVEREGEKRDWEPFHRPGFDQLTESMSVVVWHGLLRSPQL
jgi:TonB family protein